jgi:hypothetical protein
MLELLMVSERMTREQALERIPTASTLLGLSHGKLADLLMAVQSEAEARERERCAQIADEERKGWLLCAPTGASGCLASSSIRRQIRAAFPAQEEGQ